MNPATQKRGRAWLAAASAALLLSACSGDYGGGASGSNGGPGSGEVKNCDQLFTQRVQPRLDFCRSCHVPGGVADVPDGKLYMLSKNQSEDSANLRASWERLGKNDGGKSRILKMASGTDTRTHTGGTPWPVGSDAYREMDALLLGYLDPQACALGGLGSVNELPLLGSKHGGHAWFDFCDGDGTAAHPRQADGALLPVDPRSLVQPGVNAGKAVYFNGYWKDCHADPGLVQERPQPKTCGELREREALGAKLLKGDGAGTFFAATEPDGYFTFPASSYNDLWRLWGLGSRPDNFDELLVQRYGLLHSPERNPYPLAGEDPNQTSGGSGQLPLSFVQTHNADGSWSGRIGATCKACHSGEVGTPADGPGLGTLYGSGNPLGDVGLYSREITGNGMSPAAIFMLFGTSRGTNNASDVNLFYLSNQDAGVRVDQYTLDLLTSGMTGSSDTPAWWNVGHRPIRFQDGFYAGDTSRVDFVFYQPILDKKPIPSSQQQANDWVRAHNQDGETWIMSQKSPAYPLPLDTALAEQGAILFHSKNLWADTLNNPVPKPEGGNGSCASCHGAYAPRYVNDPTYLDTPALEGIASYVVPKDVIRTDPARVDTNNEAVGQYGATSFLSYSETVGTDQDCGPQNRASIRGDRQLGYLAPPLYGVWATAPYLHNGSVPNVWEMLKPSDRQPIWRRVSEPARPDQQGKVIMGFDTSLQRAYDPDKLGWKYDALSCGTGTLPFIDCDPTGAQADPALQQVLAQLYGNTILAWNLGNATVLTQWTPQQIEDRKIYNTHLYSQGNEGHEFTSVLTDPERRALIEYLKTL